MHGHGLASILGLLAQLSVEAQAIHGVGGDGAGCEAGPDGAQGATWR